MNGNEAMENLGNLNQIPFKSIVPERDLSEDVTKIYSFTPGDAIECFLCHGNQPQRLRCIQTSQSENLTAIISKLLNLHIPAIQEKKTIICTSCMSILVYLDCMRRDVLGRIKKIKSSYFELLKRNFDPEDEKSPPIKDDGKVVNYMWLHKDLCLLCDSDQGKKLRLLCSQKWLWHKVLSVLKIRLCDEIRDNTKMCGTCINKVCIMDDVRTEILKKARKGGVYLPSPENKNSEENAQTPSISSSPTISSNTTVKRRAIILSKPPGQLQSSSSLWKSSPQQRPSKRKDDSWRQNLSPSQQLEFIMKRHRRTGLTETVEKPSENVGKTSDSGCKSSENAGKTLKNAGKSSENVREYYEAAKTSPKIVQKKTCPKKKQFYYYRSKTDKRILKEIRRHGLEQELNEMLFQNKTEIAESTESKVPNTDHQYAIGCMFDKAVEFGESLYKTGPISEYARVILDRPELRAEIEKQILADLSRDANGITWTSTVLGRKGDPHRPLEQVLEQAGTEMCTKLPFLFKTLISVIYRDRMRKDLDILPAIYAMLLNYKNHQVCAFQHALSLVSLGQGIPHDLLDTYRKFHLTVSSYGVPGLLESRDKAAFKKYATNIVINDQEEDEASRTSSAQDQRLPEMVTIDDVGSIVACHVDVEPEMDEAPSCSSHRSQESDPKTKVKKEPPTCTICGGTFTNSDHLKRHMVLYHKDHVPSEVVVKKEPSVENQGSKPSKSKTAKNPPLHKTTYNIGLLPTWDCKLCGRRYKKLFQLHEHVKTVHAHSRRLSELLSQIKDAANYHTLLRQCANRAKSRIFSKNKREAAKKIKSNHAASTSAKNNAEHLDTVVELSQAPLSAGDTVNNSELPDIPPVESETEIDIPPVENETETDDVDYIDVDHPKGKQPILKILCHLCDKHIPIAIVTYHMKIYHRDVGDLKALTAEYKEKIKCLKMEKAREIRRKKTLKEKKKKAMIELKKAKAREGKRIRKVKGSLPECRQCGKVFASISLRQSHYLVEHNPRRPPTCAICRAQFSTVELLREHVNTQHPNEKVPMCEYCGVILNSMSAIADHKRVIHPEKLPFSCDLCTGKFNNQQGLTLHIQKKHRDQLPHACTVCCFVAKTEDALQPGLIPHIQKKHRDQLTHACTVCCFVGKTEDAQQRHSCASYLRRRKRAKPEDAQASQASGRRLLEITGVSPSKRKKPTAPKQLQTNTGEVHLTTFLGANISIMKTPIIQSRTPPQQKINTPQFRRSGTQQIAYKGQHKDIKTQQGNPSTIQVSYSEFAPTQTSSVQSGNQGTYHVMGDDGNVYEYIETAQASNRLVTSSSQLNIPQTMYLQPQTDLNTLSVLPEYGNSYYANL